VQYQEDLTLMIEQLKCIDPAQVDELDYLAWIEQDSRPEFTRHLERCLYCQAEIKTYKSWDSLLHRQFAFITGPTRTMCADAQALGEFALGLLPPVESKKIKAHTKQCQFCADELAALKDWLPEPVVREITPPHNPPVLIPALRRVMAHLINFSDSLGTPGYAMAGVRGSDEGLPQTYQAEEVSITVTVQSVEPHSKQRMVLGLIHRDNYPMEATAGAEVRIREGDQILATETVDELGNFMFAEVVPPEYFDLEIALDDKIVLVPHLGLL